MVVPVQEFVFVVVGSVVLSLVILAGFWPWARQARRLVTIALATTVGIVIWNLALNQSNASALNVDTQLLGLSVQDVGSGVLAFVTTALLLRLTERGEPLARLLSVSAIVGLVTIVVDRFA